MTPYFLKSIDKQRSYRLKSSLDRYLGANKYLINLVENFLTNVPKSRKNTLIKINIMLTLSF